MSLRNRFAFNASATKTAATGTTKKINRSALVLLSIGAFCVGAHAGTCSSASAAGHWGFSYTGVALTSSAQIPIASAGRYTQDPTGDMHGTEVTNLGGTAVNEVIQGKFTVNANCTTELRVNVYEGGQLIRTSVIDGVLVQSSSKVRAIFRSVTLPDGSNLPVVIAVEGEKMF